MTNHKELYNSGLEYFHNAINFSKTNRFGEEITYSVIGMSAEYLMSAMLFKNDIEPYGSGIDNILLTLEENNLIPEDIKSYAIQLQKQCSCKETIDSTKPNTDDLIGALRGIKGWADAAFKPVLI